jgi:beta-lactamase regulating signal transducer with metallopeptidase domain
MMSLFQSSIIHLLGVWVAVSCLSGLMIFLIIKVFDTLFSNQSSTDRYNKSITAVLFFFIFTMAGTFYFHNNSFQQKQAQVNTKVTKPVDDFNADALVLQMPVHDNIASPQKNELFNTESLLKSLGIFWMIGALVFTIKMMGGYFYTRNLIISSQSSIPEKWNHFIIQQLERLQISKNIKVFESHRINSAFTFGFIKPFIVLPVGFFTSLPPDQIEAVLLHELYHIKHKDYLVNILTMAFEVIFFYHPVMWWLAKNIRQERENRCDDQVTKILDKKVYAHALLNMESYRQSLNYAIPFSNKQSNLKMRIMRIFEQKPEQNMGLKPFLSLLMIVAFLMSFTFYKLEEPKIEFKPESKKQLNKDLKETENLKNSDEDILFKTEDSKLDIVIEMTNSSLIAKSNNKTVRLYLDENLQLLNEKILYGGQDIVSMYKNEKESSYHFFTKQYFESFDRNKWVEENKNRSIYIFDASDDSSFLIRLPESYNSKNSKVNTNKTEEHIQNPAQSINSINKIEKKSADLSEIKIHGPIQLQFKDKTYQNGDTNNLEILKKLVKKFGSDENAEVKIKIDGKLIADGTDIEKALGKREINSIRIVLPSKDAEYGLLEIITKDVQEMRIEEASAEKKEGTEIIEEIPDKEKTIAIGVFYETKDGDFSGEIKMDADKERVLDVLGYKSSEILFVVNGKVQEHGYKPKDIKPNNIKSMTVLKDQKATEKYGERAKNGVIEIYLKKE